MTFSLSFWERDYNYKEIIEGPFLVSSESEGYSLGNLYLPLYENIHSLSGDSIWFEVKELSSLPSIDSLNLIIKRRDEERKAYQALREERIRKEREYYLLKLNQLKESHLYEARTGHLVNGSSTHNHDYLIVRKSTPKILSVSVSNYGCSVTLEPTPERFGNLQSKEPSTQLPNPNKNHIIGKGVSEQEAWEDISLSTLEQTLNDIGNYSLII